MIVPSKKRNGKRVWLLVTRTRTYEHPTRAAAERQERAISISKARARGHRISKR